MTQPTCSQYDAQPWVHSATRQRKLPFMMLRRLCRGPRPVTTTLCLGPFAGLASTSAVPVGTNAPFHEIIYNHFRLCRGHGQNHN